ncbi:MAG: restriction endonuclease subunit S [Melioribacteraceae bacterium]|nr:restriction endonuclease subunit S [Melioribacteraceae bacterium]MCF8354855.1 restriction endonuclease subunit S [Melioribacteraceae bacterium]MCF8392962.1 restriction endonuclease subunit S [Melioribacteraceae bacterium]MCF8417295.1 restriction endonuclease subunit S [Melioribacteraceae bacterium]
MKLLFENFEKIIDSSNGIEKARELVLQLAIEGKLVKQIQDDEPAINLIEKFQLEKEDLIEKGLLKRQPYIENEKNKEKKNNLPKSWETEFLGNLVHYITKGSTPTTYDFQYQDSGIPFIKVENVKRGRIFIDGKTKYISEEAHEFQKRSQLQSNDILFSIAGTIGETCIISSDILPANTNQAFAIIRGSQTVFFPQFLRLLLNSHISLSTKNLARGGAMNNISLGDLKNMLTIIPPYNEQKRIVEKVDSLMSFLDELEEKRNRREEKRIQLNKSSLDKLVKSKNEKEFKLNWDRLTDNFDKLYSVTKNVDKLKQTILQLAVQGKLTEHWRKENPNAEPASELLKKIKAEKEKLIKEGKIKKSKELPPIKEEEKAFELPESWEWVRLGFIASFITKGSSPKWQGVNYVDDKQLLFITSENVGSFKLLLGKRKYVEWKFNKIEPRSILKQGDFLMNIVGASIGRTAIYSIDETANINQAVCLIRFSHSFYEPDYFLQFFNSNACLVQMFDKQVVMARPNLSMTNISKFLIPVPPITEQREIVKKTNELIEYCNQLKQQIESKQQKQEKLVEVVVKQIN